MSLHGADNKCEISYRWSRNGLECTSLCAPKVVQEVNIPKYFSSICIQEGWIVVVHLCFGFSVWRQMAPQHSAEFRAAFFG